MIGGAGIGVRRRKELDVAISIKFAPTFWAILMPSPVIDGTLVVMTPFPIFLSQMVS